MLQQIKNITPKIDYGFGTYTKHAAVGEPVTVWLQTLYNQGAYTFYLQTTGTVSKISNYQYEVAFAAPGTYTLQLVVTPVTKATSLQSNILEITIV